MNETVATCREIGRGILQVRIKDGIDPNAVIEELNRFFDHLMRKSVHHFVFDLGNVQFPGGSFIALIISLSMKARLKGGDISIINLQETARNHFSIFTPLTFLTIGADTVAGSDIKSGEGVQPGKIYSLELEATVDALNQGTGFVVDIAERAGIQKVDLSKINIAVYEACMNVIEHGYEFDPGNIMRIEVVLDNNQLIISIMDHGKSFDFYNRKGYDVEEAFHEKRDGGFGLFIIQRSVDEISYRSDPEMGNCLVLKKRLTKPD